MRMRVCVWVRVGRMTEWMRRVNRITQKPKAINLPYAIECNLYFGSSPHSSLDIFEPKIHKSHGPTIYQIQSYLISDHYTHTSTRHTHTHAHCMHWCCRCHQRRCPNVPYGSGSIRSVPSVDFCLSALCERGCCCCSAFFTIRFMNTL